MECMFNKNKATKQHLQNHFSAKKQQNRRLNFRLFEMRIQNMQRLRRKPRRKLRQKLQRKPLPQPRRLSHCAERPVAMASMNQVEPNLSLNFTSSSKSNPNSPPVNKPNALVPCDRTQKHQKSNLTRKKNANTMQGQKLAGVGQGSGVAQVTRHERMHSGILGTVGTISALRRELHTLQARVPARAQSQTG